MIKIGEQMSVKTLHKQGISDRQIAKLLGISRNTVTKYIESDESPQYHRKEPYRSILDDFKEYLQDRLKIVPEVTAERLHRELTERGYQGSYPTVVNWVRLHRSDSVPEAFTRYETEPGEWAQVDWGEFGETDHFGVKRKVYCFSYVLCYSRAQYIEFTLSCDISTLLRSHMNAFRYLGGVPQKILYDNMKTVVLEHIGDNIRFNERFLDFALHYGFVPKAAGVNYPEAKGKVERSIGYIRSSLFNGGSFSGLEDLNRQRWSWLEEVCNVRIHGTTGARPIDRLAEERGHLQCLRSPDYEVCEVLLRRVHKDCYIRYQNNWYSVPWSHVGRSVTLKVYERDLKIFDAGHLLATHPICSLSHQFIRNPEHWEGIVRRQGGALTGYRARFEHYGELGVAFMTGGISERFPNLYYHWQKILELAESYPAGLVEQALQRCLHYKAFKYDVFRKVLERSVVGRVATAPSITLCGRCREDLPEVVTRSLEYYSSLLPLHHRPEA
jgi:transposase